MFSNSAENPAEELSGREIKTTRQYKQFDFATLQRMRARAKSKPSFADAYPEKRATRCLNPGAEEMTLSEVSKASSLYFEWICENNPDHLFPSSVSNRREYSCPTCNNMRRSARLRKIKTDPNNLLIDKFPAHFAQLIHARDTNGDLIARETLAAKSGAIGWWDIGCKHGPFPLKIGDRTREPSDRGCRKCGNESAANKGRLAAVEKNGSLRRNMPQLAAEWLYPIDDHEGRADITPDTCALGSSIRVQWSCSAVLPTGQICGHEYPAKIADRARNNHGCSNCKTFKCGQDKRKNAVMDHGSIQDHPLLSVEFRSLFDSTRAYLTAADISLESGYPVIWECSHHPGQFILASPNSRLRSESQDGKITGCNDCSLEKRSAWGYTRNLDTHGSLADNFPEVAKEWVDCAEKPDQTPFITRPGSHLEVEWKCQSNPKHKTWFAVVYSRAAGSECPCCKSSKGEAATEKALLTLEMKFTPQKSVKKLLTMMGVHKDGISGRLSYDFLIHNEDQSVYALIEFQGEHHYRPINFRGSKLSERQLQKKFEMVLKRDQIKRDFAKEFDIPLLEIPFSDIDNIEILLIEFFKQIKGVN